MHDPLDATTVIFAVLAVFVLWRLWSVLGAKNGGAEDSQPGAVNRFSNAQGPSEDNNRAESNVVRLPVGAGVADTQARPVGAMNFEPYAKTEKARTGLVEIVEASGPFDLERFVSGAKTAYEMIVGAFADGNRPILSSLLAPEVLSSFYAVIEQRESIGQQASTRFVSFGSIEVVDAGVKDRQAMVTLKIVAQIISCIRDRNGNVVDGDSERVVSTDDLWTFARPIGSKDPNWKLVATESEHRS